MFYPLLAVSLVLFNWQITLIVFGVRIAIQGMVYFLSMKRLIDWHLMSWKEHRRRKPLVLKGARQVGKTYSVRQPGRQFESFAEINFELIPEAKTIFEKDLKKRSSSALSSW